MNSHEREQRKVEESKRKGEEMYKNRDQAASRLEANGQLLALGFGAGG